MTRFFISTAIPYVNAEPHIGFALELIQADVMARYQRLLGKEVFFLTGADENSLKNVRAAEERGVDAGTFVAEHAEKFRRLHDDLNISNDDFIRTSEPRHGEGARKLWLACRNDIYKKKYRGLYCVGCELFYKESELAGGLCPEHKTRPESVEEENYFFRLSAYADRLRALLESETLVLVPEYRKNELLALIGRGLEDFSISRSTERSHGWGIPVPDDESQIMYVWFDALTNYINALGYADEGENYRQFWAAPAAETVHAIGKGITRFHAVYWPAMLLSAGVALPKKIFVHGYITSEGEKMSKSLGNAVNPSVLAKKYGIDALRYFLLREMPAYEDGDYSEHRFIERYNADLAHGLGNLVSRSLTLMAKQDVISAETSELEAAIREAKARYHEHLGAFRFHGALEAIWGLIGELDGYITKRKPWELSPDSAELRATLSTMWHALNNVADLLLPFMPATAETIRARLTSGQTEKKTYRIQKPQPLFSLIKE